jgi:hypothetical protein
MSKNSNGGKAAEAEAKQEESAPLVPFKNGASGAASSNNSGSAGPTPAYNDSSIDVSRVVILNVGGQKHEALRKNFERYPQSRLWKTMRATNVDEILRHCDRYRVLDANGGVPEYFFDKNYTRCGLPIG